MNKIKNIYKSNIFKFIIVCLVFYYGRYLQYIPIILFNLEKRSISTNLLLSTFSNFLECLFFLWIFRKDLKEDFYKFKKNIRFNFDVGLKFGIMGVLLMMISNILIASFVGNINSQNEVLVQKMIDSVPWVMLIDTALLGPFIEEMVFRRGFRLVIKNKWAYVIISGFVFGFMHIIFSFSDLREFLFVFPYAFAGCSYALCYTETDTIFTSITVHALHNTFLTLLSIL